MIDLVFEKNSPKLPNVVKQRNTPKFCNIKCTRSFSFTSKDLKKIGDEILYLLENHLPCKNVIIDVRTNVFSDSVVVSVLEFFIYSLVKSQIYDVKLRISYDVKLAQNIYFVNSILSKYNNSQINVKEMIDYIEGSETYTKKGYYRKRIKNETDSLNALALDANITLLTSGVNDRDIIDEIIESISELVINMFEHGKSDCFVVIHIVNTYSSYTKSKGKLVTFSVFNASDIKLYSGLKEMIANEQNKTQATLLYDALKFHKERFYVFDEENRIKGYEYNDFLMIGAFQRSVSSRKDYDPETSGSGLTRTIKKMVDHLWKEENNEVYSYMISGYNIILFDPSMLSEISNNGFSQIGFNISGDFMNDVPEKKILDRSSYYYNGTAFYFQVYIENGEK